MKKVLLLGSSGKLGAAIGEILSSDYEVVGVNSTNLDVCENARLDKLVGDTGPNLVINAVVKSGIDQCEEDPHASLLVNSILPKNLAILSSKYKFKLIHFSTDSVFDGRQTSSYYFEDDLAYPVNIYGATKLTGDSLVQAYCGDYYIFRVSGLFGRSRRVQFVENMLERVRAGETRLVIADDIVTTPTHSYDIARAVRNYIADGLSPGLYHLANSGKASLFELMQEITTGLNLDVHIEKASHRDFPSIGLKNLHTPLASRYLDSLRPWQEAVAEYCQMV